MLKVILSHYDTFFIRTWLLPILLCYWCEAFLFFIPWMVKAKFYTFEVMFTSFWAFSSMKFWSLKEFYRRVCLRRSREVRSVCWIVLWAAWERGSGLRALELSMLANLLTKSWCEVGPAPFCCFFEAFSFSLNMFNSRMSSSRPREFSRENSVSLDSLEVLLTPATFWPFPSCWYDSIEEPLEKSTMRMLLAWTVGRASCYYQNCETPSPLEPAPSAAATGAS